MFVTNEATGSKVLAPVDALELFNSGQWEITGGRGVTKKERLPVTGGSLDESGLTLLRPPGPAIRLVFGDVVLLESPARMIIRGFVPTKCMRPKAQGGGEYVRMLPDTRFRLQNKTMQAELERKAREAEEARRREWADRYKDAIGGVIDHITESFDGRVIHFTDGRELVFIGAHNVFVRAQAPTRSGT